MPRAPLPLTLLRLVICAAASVLALSGAVAEEGVLTSAAAIRALPLAKAQVHPPARIRGVVTFCAQWEANANVTVQDATAGIYAGIPRSAPRLRMGDEVELSGRVVPGGFAPSLEANEVRVIGRASLPEAPRVDFASLMGGQYDSQLVEVEGVVRDVQRGREVIPPSTILTLALPGGRAEVFLALMPEAEFTPLVDARVRVRAVVFHYFNPRRQTFAFRLMVAEAWQVETLAPSPGAPWALPITPVRELRQFSPAGPSPHRVRVQGVVSLHWPGELLILQEGADGLRVRSRQPGTVQPGDFVDVVAFAEMGRYAAQLDDAVFRKIGEEAVPAPAQMELSALLAGQADARLVQVEAELDAVAEQNGYATLMLRAGKVVLPAQLQAPISALPAWRTGSRVRVTGVCEVEVGSSQRYAAVFQPESARLLLRSADDVAVLRAATWWTPRRLSLAVAALGGALGLALAWVWTVQHKNTRLRAEVAAREQAESEVRRRADERQMLAADLHDSLEQSLTGVALQLRAARDTVAQLENSRHVTLAERLLEHSRGEVHRTVRDLRQPGDEPLDLAEALRDLVQVSGSASAARVELEIPQTLPELSAPVRYHLLRLAQEGVTNALKHARAKRIAVALRLEENAAVLTISDDGAGFDPTSRRGPAQGHFGLQGMKERAARLNGVLRIEATPGAGTRLEAIVPLAA